MNMAFFKSDPWLQRVEYQLQSFDDANDSFFISSLGWLYFKMLLFHDLFNSSRVRVFWGLLPCYDEVRKDPKNALTMEFFFDQYRVLTLYSRWWCSHCLQKWLGYERIFLIILWPWCPSRTLIFESLSVPYWATLDLLP